MGAVKSRYPHFKKMMGLMIMDFETTLGLLSNMYLCKPTKEAIQNWKTLLDEDAPDFMLGLKVAIDEIDSNSEQELEDLLWEYTRLFIGPYKLPCPPWESVYTSGKKLMMQEAYDVVQDLYNEAGLKIDHPNIMPDHIGAELNFLAILFQKMNSSPEKKLRYTGIVKGFLNEHLVRWIPQFTSDMERGAVSKFYKALAQVTRDLIMAQHSYFG